MPTGTKQPGEPCVSSDECADFPNAQSECSDHVCTTFVQNPEGEPCDGELAHPPVVEHQCEEYLSCEAGICRRTGPPPGKLGESCSVTGLCEGLLKCDGNVCVPTDESTGVFCYRNGD
jgi:hypothetical protein